MRGGRRGRIFEEDANKGREGKRRGGGRKEVVSSVQARPFSRESDKGRLTSEGIDRDEYVSDVGL